MPTADAKPATAVPRAIADNVYVHVDRFERREVWRLRSGHSGILWQEVARCRLKVASWEKQQSATKISTTDGGRIMWGKIMKKSKKVLFWRASYYSIL